MNRTPRLSKSGIEYLDYVWGFYSGCWNWKNGVCPVGENCWAKGITVRFPAHYPNGFEPTYYPEAFLSPLHLKKPSIIGVAFMGDLFGDWVDPSRQFYFEDGYNSLKQIIYFVIRACPQHTFLFLTKCPWNLPKWSPFPDNCWVGVTVTNDSMMQPAYKALDCIIAKVKYISLEPYLSRLSEVNIRLIAGAEFYRWLDWLIMGGKSGKDPFYPPWQWIGEIEDAADKASIPVFEKYNLRPEWPNLPRLELPCH